MKKILFGFGLMMLLSGCFSSYKSTSSIVKYVTNNNFFMSESNSVSFDYQPIGSVRSLVTSGYERNKFIKVTPEEALQVLYMEAEKNGANGIINLKIEYHYSKGTIEAVSASGMAIKR